MEVDKNDNWEKEIYICYIQVCGCKKNKTDEEI